MLRCSVENIVVYECNRTYEHIVAVLIQIGVSDQKMV